MRSTSSSRLARRGLTLTEIMAVIGIIAVLLAILLPGLATIRKAGEQATSESAIRQLFTYIKSYATDNREFVVPSSFDYREANYPGKVRTNSPRSATPYTVPVQGGVFDTGDAEHVDLEHDAVDLHLLLPRQPRDLRQVDLHGQARECRA